MNLEYTIVIIVLWLFYLFKSKISTKDRLVVSSILCLIFIAQAGFRDYIHTSNDTWNYWRWFESLKDESLSNIISKFSLTYDSYENRDPGFEVFIKLCQLVGCNFRKLLILVATIISVPLCRILYKYVPTVNGLFMSAIIYQALFAGFFNTGMRQTIALGLCLFSMMYYERQKPFPHYLLILIAYTIHASAILFAPLYLIRKLKAKKVLLGAFVLTPLTMIFATNIIAFFGSGTIYESYAVNSTDNLGTPIFTAMIAMITVATAIYYKRIIVSFKESMFLIQAIAIALMLTPASWVDSNFLRITYYYLIFLLPLFPIMIETMASNNPKMKMMLYGVSSFVLLFMMYR